MFIGLEKPHFAAGIGKPHKERFRACEVPQRARVSGCNFFHFRALPMPFRPNRLLPLLPGQNDGVAAAPRGNLQGRFDRSIEISAAR
jgi:hypothetical protein